MRSHGNEMNSVHSLSIADTIDLPAVHSTAGSFSREQSSSARNFEPSQGPSRSQTSNGRRFWLSRLSIPLLTAAECASCSALLRPWQEPSLEGIRR